MVKCPACGRRYPPSLQLAGKKFRCVCGQPIHVPYEHSVSVPAAPTLPPEPVIVTLPPPAPVAASVPAVAVVSAPLELLEPEDDRPGGQGIQLSRPYPGCKFWMMVGVALILLALISNGWAYLSSTSVDLAALKRTLYTPEELDFALTRYRKIMLSVYISSTLMLLLGFSMALTGYAVYCATWDKYPRNYEGSIVFRRIAPMLLAVITLLFVGVLHIPRVFQERVWYHQKHGISAAPEKPDEQRRDVAAKPTPPPAKNVTIRNTKSAEDAGTQYLLSVVDDHFKAMEKQNEQQKIATLDSLQRMCNPSLQQGRMVMIRVQVMLDLMGDRLSTSYPIAQRIDRLYQATDPEHPSDFADRWRKNHPGVLAEDNDARLNNPPRGMGDRAQDQGQTPRTPANKQSGAVVEFH